MLKKIFTVLLATLLACTSCGTPVISKAGKASRDAAASAAENTSLLNFCNAFAVAASDGNSHKNTIHSPLSAYLALSMAAEGAFGDTKAELESVLGKCDPDGIYALLSHLSSLTETDLKIANSVWLDEGFTAEKAWLDTVSGKYLSDVFSTKLSDAADRVNRWIEDKTDGKIRDMIQKDALADARTLLINAISMDATWMSEFSKDDTIKGRKFTNFDGGISIADYLYANKHQLIIEEGSFTGVVLPYSDENLVFVALMNNDSTQPASSATAFAAENGGFAALAQKAKSENVKLYLPIFKHDASLQLNDILKNMGIKAAFDQSLADFSKMSADESLYISDVLQNATIRIDEEGTEAAAATVVTMAPTSFMPEQEIRVIDFNHPFAFAVVDRKSGVPLFCGEHNFD